jgi:platelet-activating factor acetylhydrolase
MYWDDNFRAAVGVCDEVKQQGSLAWLLTVRGTVHISQSDFCILYPKTASLILKQTINARRAIDINISASLEFLAQVMPRPTAPFHRCLESEKLFESPCIERLPTEHKPAEKWTAVRLKLPHETRDRFVPSVRHKLKKYGGVVGEEKEIWMHMAPSAEELKSRYLGRVCPTNQTASDEIDDVEKISQISAADRRTSKGFVAATTPVWPVAKGE